MYYDQSVLAVSEVYNISSAYTEHSFTENYDSVLIYSEPDVIKQQQNIIEYLYTLNNRLQAKQTELDELKKQGEPQWEYTWQKRCKTDR